MNKNIKEICDKQLKTAYKISSFVIYYIYIHRGTLYLYLQLNLLSVNVYAFLQLQFPTLTVCRLYFWKLDVAVLCNTRETYLPIVEQDVDTICHLHP